MTPREKMAVAFAVAAVMLASPKLGKISWWLGVPAGLASLGAGVWLGRRQLPKSDAQAGPVISGGLRVVEKPLPAAKSRPHGLRVTISTEMPVAHGLRVICDSRILEFEALAQSGRGATARQGVPGAVREAQRGLLFALRNSAGQRELVLRVDLFAIQPIHLDRVEQIGAAAAAALPEWRELVPMNPLAATAVSSPHTAPAPPSRVADGAPAPPHHPGPSPRRRPGPPPRPPRAPSLPRLPRPRNRWPSSSP